MKIYTNRYHDFTSSQGIPVLITYGSPRWRLPYTIAASAKTVTPGRWFMEGTDEEFTERYRAMLDGLLGAQFDNGDADSVYLTKGEACPI